MGFNNSLILLDHSDIVALGEPMKARFNGIAALRSEDEILVKEGKIYQNELVITEMQVMNTGTLWKAPIIPSTTRTNLVRDMKFKVKNVVVDCKENKTTFDVEDI